MFCLCSMAMQGQKTRLGQGLPSAKSGGDYQIKVHISGVHYREEYLEGRPGPNHTEEVIYADAVINGKKVELRGDKNASYEYYKVPLGDLQARLIKDPHKMGDAPMFQEYEVVLPNKTLWHSIVTGISE
jgi:hypothetical protein